jgi:very-short-patch-repair endonuclease
MGRLWNPREQRRRNGREFLIRGYRLCLEACLIVEIDGGQHALPAAADQRRTEWLAQHGYRVIRFWNHEVLSNPDGALQVIGEGLEGPSPSR